MIERTIRNRTAIVGVGYTPVLRYAQRSLGSIAVDAALAAIEDAGLRRDDIRIYPISGVGQSGEGLFALRGQEQALQIAAEGLALIPFTEQIIEGAADTLPGDRGQESPLSTNYR